MLEIWIIAAGCQNALWFRIRIDTVTQFHFNEIKGNQAFCKMQKVSNHKRGKNVGVSQLYRARISVRVPIIIRGNESCTGSIRVGVFFTGFANGFVVQRSWGNADSARVAAG